MDTFYWERNHVVNDCCIHVAKDATLDLLLSESFYHFICLLWSRMKEHGSFLELKSAMVLSAINIHWPEKSAYSCQSMKSLFMARYHLYYFISCRFFHIISIRTYGFHYVLNLVKLRFGSTQWAPDHWKQNANWTGSVNSYLGECGIPFVKCDVCKIIIYKTFNMYVLHTYFHLTEFDNSYLCSEVYLLNVMQQT